MLTRHIITVHLSPVRYKKGFIDFLVSLNCHLLTETHLKELISGLLHLDLESWD